MWHFIENVRENMAISGQMVDMTYVSTHPRLDKMSEILQKTLLSAFSWMKSFVLNKISLKFVPKGPIDNNPPLI